MSIGHKLLHELASQAEQGAGDGWALVGRKKQISWARNGRHTAAFKVDEASLVAAVIYRQFESQITLNHVRNQFGAEVSLVEGVLKCLLMPLVIRHDEFVLGQTSDQIDQQKKC